MQSFLIASLFIILFTIKRGSSQDPCSNDDNIVIGTDTISVDGSADPVPVCIRCGYLVSFQLQLVTNLSQVTYLNDNGDPLVNNTNNIVITDNGLILNDPAGSFPDPGDGVQCQFDDGIRSEIYPINIVIFFFNPPPITPSGDILDYIEGYDVTLTCTGDPEVGFDNYQWTLPDGTVEPNSPDAADPPNGLELSLVNISRTQSGVYICTGSIIGGNDDRTVESNVTLNIQYPVKIVSFTPSDSTVTVGPVLTLNCTFDGNPSPSIISWSQNGSELDVQNDPNLSETITDGYALLNVSYYNSVTVYGCTVNNTVGSDKANYTLSASTAALSSTIARSPSTTVHPAITTTTTTTTTPTTNPNSSLVPPAAYIVPVVICLVALFIVVFAVFIFFLHKRFSLKRSNKSDTMDKCFSNPAIANNQDMSNNASGSLITNNATTAVYATVLIKKKPSVVIKNEERTETPPPEIQPFDYTLPETDEWTLAEEKNQPNDAVQESDNVKEKKSSQNEIIYAELNIVKKKKKGKSSAIINAEKDKVIYSTIVGNNVQPPPVPKRTRSIKQIRQEIMSSELREIASSVEGNRI